MSRPTFVVGTGRCGSTMLSNMLRQHPLIASMSEFFSTVCDVGGRIPEAFSEQELDGEQFWTFISAIAPREALALRHGVVMPEVIYPYDSPTARYSAQSGVPAILQVTLPHLTDDHDALFDELGKQVKTWPTQLRSEHYRALFDWLTQRFGKQIWIERTGGVHVIIEPLHDFFPDARFIHIVRDGRDTAISIREHLGFRIFIVGSMLTEMLGVDPYVSSDRTHIDQVPPPLRAFLPESFDAQAFHDYRVPLDMCGGLWSQQIDNGLKVLNALPDESVHTVRYEDILADPAAQLDRLTRFLGAEFVNDDWATTCAQVVRTPRSSWRNLPASEADALSAACQPGFELLRSAGVDYP
ncbi:sulfotransferase family protein [Haliangium sp.]|uniref:sulfotransferase family protein n=1 Tax=Haliangium sp. TaxID=2663208 RepID=UPI003D127F7F